MESDSDKIRRLADLGAQAKAREAQRPPEGLERGPADWPVSPPAAASPPPTSSRPPTAGRGGPEGRDHGRFVKGVSGNRRGRPSKISRAATTQQGTEDIISSFEELLPVNKHGKTVKLPFFLIMIEQCKLDALKNPSEKKAKFLIDLYYRALEQNTAKYSDIDAMIHRLEERNQFENDPVKRHEGLEFINKLKRMTQPPKRR